MANPRRLEHGRGVSWEITYRVEGRMVRQRFPTKAAALDALAAARVEIRRGTHLAPVESKTTLAAYTARWAQGLQVARSTRDHYDVIVRRHIIPALGRRPLNTLRRTDIVIFVAELVDKGLAASTIESIYNLLAMILRAAVYDRMLAVSPCFRIKLPPRPPRRLAAFTPGEVRLLLEHVKPEHRALLATAVGTGMRQGELLGLRAHRINFLRRELSVEEQCLTPSGGAPYLTPRLKTPASRRVVPLPPFALEALSIHISARGTREDGVMFRNPHGGLWRRGAINSCFWKPTLVRAGLPTSYGMHALRHTYASGLIAEGLHPRVIQARLGHKSIVETMDTYGHLFPDQNEETADALQRLFGEAPSAKENRG
jgi:integrase